MPATRSSEKQRATASRAGAIGLTERQTNRQVRSPEPDDIARLAYAYWEARQGQGGSPEEDWLRAEAELRDRNAMGARAN